MKVFLLIALSLLEIFSIISCSAPATAVPSEPTGTPIVNPTAGFRTEIPAVTTRTDRRAPTLAPTGTATEIPAATATEMASATPVPSDTAVPSATATVAATFTAIPVPSSTRPNATATPNLAPAVYVTGLELDPSAPKSNAEFVFHVSFLNTVGAVVSYPHWRVLIMRQGQTNSVGDPQGVSKNIETGVSQQDTVPAKIKIKGPCEDYTAQPIWEMEDGKQIPFLQPDGKNITLDFQVCP